MSAAVLNSAQSSRTRAAALVAACAPGEFNFVSPEQLRNDETREALRRARPGLFVVDATHLVSQWGRDFRPDYLCHADTPASVDSYYQELGRAGRDGERAEARLLYRAQDVGAASHLDRRAGYPVGHRSSRCGLMHPWPARIRSSLPSCSAASRRSPARWQRC